jgi:hypothetical protein
VTGVLLQQMEQDPPKGRSLLRRGEPPPDLRTLTETGTPGESPRQPDLLDVRGHDARAVLAVRHTPLLLVPTGRIGEHVLGGEPPAHPPPFDEPEMLDEPERGPPQRFDRGTQLRVGEPGGLADQGVAVPVEIPQEELTRIGDSHPGPVEGGGNRRGRRLRVNLLVIGHAPENNRCHAVPTSGRGDVFGGRGCRPLDEQLLVDVRGELVGVHEGTDPVVRRGGVRAYGQGPV